MPGRPAHRWGDPRFNGLPTIPGPDAQEFVRIAGQPWAVAGDTTLLGGFLIPLQFFVRIDGVPVILVNDDSTPDTQCPITGLPNNCDPFPMVGTAVFVTVAG